MERADAVRAMTTWIGALARGGLLLDRDEEEGALLALRVLGDDGLSRLREAFRSGETASRERRGAILACIWMAQADREIVREEVDLLERIIARSELGRAAIEDLQAAIVEPQRPLRFAEELTQPELRELIVALGWLLASADGRVDDEEREAWGALCEALGITEARSTAIRDAVLGGATKI